MSRLPVQADSGCSGTPWAAPAQSAASTRCREIATEIHDRALQSIALCLLQTELAKRHWERGEPEKALAEIEGLGPELETAAEMLRAVMSELLALSDSRARSA